MTKIFVSSEQRVKVGTNLTPLGHQDQNVYGIKVQGDGVHTVLGESSWRTADLLLHQQFWAKETWQSAPQQGGHSDTKGAAQCSSDTLPRLSCFKAYFMLQKVRPADLFASARQPLQLSV